ncbi:MAG TPA: SRPBCC family protein [Acidimicrobiales bacterium]|nr:SRPBCC family protein [Acidimicrobiales bacterium]
MSDDLPDSVTTDLRDDSVIATTTVDATPAEVFDFLRQPANHSIISGDGSVTGATSGPDRLSMGDRFGMSMKIVLPYRMRNTVVEYEQDRRIAWCHPGKHRWRWELEPDGEGRTKLTETFDMSTAVFPPALRLLGYPKRHLPNVARSVANVRDHFARR